MTAKQPRKLFLKHIVRKVFLEDWALKLTALAITFALWIGVTGLSTPTTKRLTVPLNLNIASNAQVTNVPWQEVEIEISGDKRVIDRINRNQLSASLDLTEMKPGEWVITLSPDTVSVPLDQGITLVGVVPGRIPINLEAVEEKEIEVKAETMGNPAAGYEVYSVTALPQKIRVRGPVSVINLLDHVQTDQIDIAGKKDGFTAKQITVNSTNPKASVLNTVVDVFFRIGEKRIERAFSLPISGLPGKTASFILFGPRTLLQKLKSDDLKVEMVLDDNGEEVPQVILPAELQEVAAVRKLTAK